MNEWAYHVLFWVPAFWAVQLCVCQACNNSFNQLNKFPYDHLVTQVLWPLVSIVKIRGKAGVSYGLMMCVEDWTTGESSNTPGSSGECLFRVCWLEWWDDSWEPTSADVFMETTGQGQQEHYQQQCHRHHHHRQRQGLALVGRVGVVVCWAYLYLIVWAVPARCVSIATNSILVVFLFFS